MSETLPAYATVLWAGTPLYTCLGCGFQRFYEPHVRLHCDTCPHLAALTTADEAVLPLTDTPPPAEQEG